jgi:hypothetical protein
MATPTRKGRTLSAARIESILCRLNGADTLKCRQAAEELLALPREQISAIIDYNNGIIDPGEAILTLIRCMLTLMSVYVLLLRNLPLASHILLAFGLLGGVASLIYTALTVKSHRTRCRTLNQVIKPMLDHLNGVSAVPVMADFLFDKGETAHALARAVLIRQLPRLEPGQAALLADSQQHRLNDILRGNDVELIIAILQAYAQVGDASTLEPVGILARSAENFRVREAANLCLPPLRARIVAEEERKQQIRLGKMLLRPSAPAEPNTLLRAATPTPETASEQLLRPLETKS